MQIKINRWLTERGLKNVADNETVAAIVKRVRRECNSLPLPNAAGEKLKLVREINDAHKREMAEKDKEIARLNKRVCKYAVDADGCIGCNSDSPIYKLKEKIRALRALVKELTDALGEYRDAPCNCCTTLGCKGIENCKETKGIIELVAKAREVVK